MSLILTVRFTKKHFSLLTEKIGIKVTPNGNETRQYQYDQSDPFKIPRDKRFFLVRFH